MTPSDVGKVGVLMGGWSAEREVSLNSGAAVLKALQDRGVNVHGVDVGRDILERLERERFDRVFLTLHGRGGEDGVIQGALEVLGVPYTGSGVMGSAIGMDKNRTKLLWQALNIPTAGFLVVGSAADLDAAEELGYPLAVKPAREGSSIGITKVENAKQLKAAWEKAGRFDSDVMIERWVTGTELTIAILGDRALPIIRLETPHGFYDYAAKYQANDTGYHIPSGLDARREAELQALALEAFQAVGGYGWGRVDLILDEESRPFFLEVNTAPGMTDHSLVPMAARAVGIEFDELVWQILLQTMEKPE